MGKLRICSGVLRGRLVETTGGEGTRPLLSRVRKSLVDILRPRLQGAAVLDLFAGSGAIGFELLSNGAARCVFNELEPDTADLIRKSAKQLGLVVEVHNHDALRFLETRAANSGPFDLIMVAPPYGLGLQQRVLESMDVPAVLTSGGLVVVQRDVREEEGQVDPRRLRLCRVRRYGRTVFEFYAPAPPDPSAAKSDHSD